MTALDHAPTPVRRVERLWGTMVGVDVRDAVPAAAVDDVYRWFARVDDLFSTWRDDTEISRLATGEMTIDEVSPEVRTVLELCEHLRLISGGAFDITVGARARCAHPGVGPLDPSGVVKGWAVERAGDRLTAAGARNFVVNAGGDVLARGRPSPGREWRIGIQHPWQRDRLAAVVRATDVGVATAGRYERGDHILDPRTGDPARGLAAVTVVAPDLAIADALATAVMVRGKEGMTWVRELPEVEAMAVTDDRIVILTPGFDRSRVS